MTDRERFGFAAVTIATFLGILSEKYTDAEILNLLKRWRVQGVLKIVREKKR